MLVEWAWVATVDLRPAGGRIGLRGHIESTTIDDLMMRMVVRKHIVELSCIIDSVLCQYSKPISEQGYLSIYLCIYLSV